jgi:methyl-accepting chemotaxis protein
VLTGRSTELALDAKNWYEARIPLTEDIQSALVEGKLWTIAQLNKLGEAVSKIELAAPQTSLTNSDKVIQLLKEFEKRMLSLETTVLELKRIGKQNAGGDVSGEITNLKRRLQDQQQGRDDIAAKMERAVCATVKPKSMTLLARCTYVVLLGAGVWRCD